MENKFSIIKNQKGITLIEVLVSLCILALVLTPTIAVFSAALINNRASQASIDAKYLAEKYMEIAKATPMPELGDLLCDINAYGFNPIPGKADTYEKTDLNYLDISGIEISWEKVMSAEPQGKTSPANILDLRDISGEVDIKADWLADKVKIQYDITAAEIYNPNTVKNSLDLTILFNKPLNVHVTNNMKNPAYRLDFYCVNKDADDKISNYATMPIFDILEGDAAIYDYTETPDKLPEELAGEPSILYYKIKVTVKTENGPYIIENMKAVY